MSKTFKQHIPFLIILSCIAFFYLSSIKKSCAWGDDWAMYVAHAKNLATFKAYNQTGYLQNLNAPTYSPNAYPPAYPILLAPIYALFGLNLYYYKAYNICIFLLSLVLSYFYFKNKLNIVSNLAIVLLVGFAPFCWDMKEYILSDMPFLCFTFIPLLLIEHENWAKGWRNSLILAFSFYFVYALRSIGILLLVAYLLYLCLNFKENRLKIGKVLGFSVVFLVLNALLFAGSDNSYATMLSVFYDGKSDFWATILNKMYDSFLLYTDDFKALMNLWDGNGFPKISSTFSILLQILIFVGFLFYKKIDTLWLYIGLYIGAILVFPGFQGFRYLMPILPFLLYFAFYFIENLPQKGIQYVLYGLIFVFTGITYYNWYHKNFNKELNFGVLDERSLDLFAYLKANVKANEVLMAEKPRAIALMSGGIKHTVYPDHLHTDKLLESIDNQKVTYCIKNIWDNAFWAKYINEHPERFKKVYENAVYQVYKVE